MAASLPEPVSSTPSPRFGALLGEVRVILPEGVPVSYLAEAAIYPLPGAPRRVVGLMQVQGHPVVVLDPGVRPLAGGLGVHRQPVLVLGATPALVAIRVDEAPVPIGLGLPLADWRVPACAFAPALTQAQADARDSGQTWWHFSLQALCEALAADESMTSRAPSP